MRMTDSERQAKRRAKLKGRYGRNFSMVLSEDVSLALDRLCRAHGGGKTDTVSRLILDADNRIMTSLIDDGAGMDRYMGKGDMSPSQD